MNYSSTDEIIKDGMDLSIICHDTTKSILEFASANQQLYLIRNKEIIVFQGDKKSIGSNLIDTKFKNHSIKLIKGDTIYLFTDGYIDQFGEMNSKKFMYSNFKKLLLEINNEPLSKQKEIIEQTHFSWRGNLDQIDDILIIGIKF